MKAICLIRSALPYRRECFQAGLRRAGYSVETAYTSKPNRDDILVIWNRYGYFDQVAKDFEAAKARVVVCENGYLGKNWLGDTWMAVALNHHSGAGVWRVGGPERWDSLGVKLLPFREGGTELVILGQRGIGEPGIASPIDWAVKLRNKLGYGRIREHPGNQESAKATPIEDDLKNAWGVATWHSGGALKALVYGVPVFYDFSRWIAAQACKRILEKPANTNEDDRLNMFRRLIWAQWRLTEIESGEAFKWLLSEEVTV